MRSVSPLTLGGLAGRKRAVGPRAVPVTAACAVVGPAGLAAPLGAALALRVARAAGAPCAAVADPVAAGPLAPPRAAAARLARSLEGRGCEAVATGRLVRVAVDLERPAIAFARAAAASPGPVVLVLAGPRCADADELLAGLDVVLLASDARTDPRLREIAAHGLARLGPPVEVAAARPGPVARALALAGLTAAEPLRSAVEPALEALR